MLRWTSQNVAAQFPINYLKMIDSNGLPGDQNMEMRIRRYPPEGTFLNIFSVADRRPFVEYLHWLREISKARAPTEPD